MQPSQAGLTVSLWKSAGRVFPSTLVVLVLWSPEAEAGGSGLRDHPFLLHRELADQSVLIQRDCNFLKTKEKPTTKHSRRSKDCGFLSGLQGDENVFTNKQSK